MARNSVNLIERPVNNVPLVHGQVPYKPNRRPVRYRIYSAEYPPRTANVRLTERNASGRRKSFAPANDDNGTRRRPINNYPPPFRGSPI